MEELRGGGGFSPLSPPWLRHCFGWNMCLTPGKINGFHASEDRLEVPRMYPVRGLLSFMQREDNVHAKRASSATSQIRQLRELICRSSRHRGEHRAAYFRATASAGVLLITEKKEAVRCREKLSVPSSDGASYWASGALPHHSLAIDFNITHSYCTFSFTTFRKS